MVFPIPPGRIHQGFGGAEASMQSHPSAKLENGMNKIESEKSLRFDSSDVTGRIHQGSGFRNSTNVIRENVGNYLHIARPANYDEAFQTLQRNLTHDSAGRVHQGLASENSMGCFVTFKGLSIQVSLVVFTRAHGVT